MPEARENATPEARENALPEARENALPEAHDIVLPEAPPRQAPASIPPLPANTPAPAAPTFEDLTDVEQYAVLYPSRAARIRAEHGLPAGLDFAPPEPEISEGLINGTSPVLRALDRSPLAAAAG